MMLSSGRSAGQIGLASVSIPLLPAAATTRTPLLRAYAMASSSGCTAARGVPGDVAKLALMIRAPLSASYRNASAASDSQIDPFAVIFRFMMVAPGASPAVPRPLFGMAAMVPDTWVPWSLLSAGVRAVVVVHEVPAGAVVHVPV